MDHLARMEIEWACTKLSHAFSYCLDSRDYGRLVSLFTPDGVWERHGDRVQGRERILEVMRVRPAKQVTRHVLPTFHFVAVPETRGRATLYKLAWFSFVAENLHVALGTENGHLVVYIQT